MSTNSLDKTQRDFLWELFHKEPDWFVVLGEKLKLLKDEAWPKNMIDCVYQYDWHHKPDIYDMYFFLQFLSLLEGKNSRLGVFQIPIYSEPFPDKDIEGNNNALKNLPKPFKGTFLGGTQGADGVIEWKTPIHCTAYQEQESKGEISWGLIKPNKIQLEIGYNSSGKFLRALDFTSYGCARWPYGQEYITVFVHLDACKIYTVGDPEFNTLLEQSNETIEHVKILGRSPWERWGNCSKP